MSNDTQKADQIAYRFYTKLSLVVHNARATPDPNPQPKVDKWFNLETPDTEAFKEQTRMYRSISSLPQPTTFRLQVLLCVPELTPTQVLAYISSDSSRVPVDPTPRYILLESWNLAFAPHPPHSQPSRIADRTDVVPPMIYKHGISLFRSVYTLLHILPACKLARRAGRPRGANSGGFGIQVLIQQDGGGEDGVLGFDSAVNNSLLPCQEHVFPPVPHPNGALCMSVTYLTAPEFKIFDRESLLSSRFLSQAEDAEFTPTLQRNQQRDSLVSSPGSLPARTSLPRSPPSSVADRFVRPPPSHVRTTSLSGGSPRLQNVGLPMTRATSAAGTNAGAGSASGISDASSIRHGTPSIASREDLAPSARLRRESLGMGRTDSPGAGPLPIRRPTLPINAFKSSTLSSGSPSFHSPSTSQRQQPPISAGPSLPSRPPVHNSPTSSRAPALPSPIGAGATHRLPASPVPLAKPSPPMAPSSLGGPSSLGDRRSLASVEGISGTSSDSSPLTGARRYRSSFGHRYSTSNAAGSEGSSNSGTVAAAERVAHTSYMGANTDDDDISDFVQQIDARKPLSSLREQGSSEGADSPIEGPPSALTGRDSPQRPTTEPVLTTASEVERRLKQMTDTFYASLTGFSVRRRDRDRESSAGSSTARAPSSGPSTIGRRTLDPISFAPRRDSADASPTDRRTSLGGVPPPFVRPRFQSTGSARSGVSIASGEVLGRMDPELDDGDKQGDVDVFGREWSG